MLLRDHLKDTGETVKEFADRLGEPRSTIRKIVYQQRQPSLELAVRITQATGGAVPPSDMILPGQGAAVCGTCELRADDPVTQSCTSPRCGLRAPQDLAA